MVEKSGRTVAVLSAPVHRSLSTRKSIVHLALVVIAVLLGETSFAATASHAATGRFSEKQISSYVKIVTTELELSANRGSNFGASATAKLYCHPTILGEGVRAGVHGIYTWFTCSAMHKLDLSEINSRGVACTGFSMPIWIATSPTTVSFKPIANGAEYLSFRASAPSQVQTFLDSTYNQMTPAVTIKTGPVASKVSSKTQFASYNSCK